MTSTRALLAVLFLLTPGCRTAMIQQYNSVPLPISTRAPSIDEVAEVIREAAKGEGWRIKEERPGRMIAKYHQGPHRAIVAIEFDQSAFSITYIDSVELMYDGKKIHRAYNLWVDRLRQAIKEEARFRLP